MAMQVVLSIPPLVRTMAARELEVVESDAAEMEGTALGCMGGIIAGGVKRRQERISREED
jgi:hypothetical protein